MATVDLQWLGQLCALDGVSGGEDTVRAEVWRRLRPVAEEAWVDPLGSLVATWGWRDGRGPRLVLCAHLDEVGLIVTRIEGDGTLRFGAVGGIDPRVLPGCAVRVGRQRVPGVVALPPVHLAAAGGRDRAPAVEDLRIDIGADGADQAGRAVAPGDLVAFAGGAGPLGRLFRGKALDDRAGVAAIVAVLEALLPGQRAAGAGSVPLAAAFTVQEEIGTRGAAAVAEALGADEAVVVETTTAADLPEVPTSAEVTRLGRGPALTALDGSMTASRRLVGEIAETAAAAGIPHQWKEAASGGTDGVRFAARGAAVAAVSLPCRYLHAPCGVMDPADLAAEAELLAHWLRERARRAVPPAG